MIACAVFGCACVGVGSTEDDEANSQSQTSEGEPCVFTSLFDIGTCQNTGDVCTIDGFCAPITDTQIERIDSVLPPTADVQGEARNAATRIASTLQDPRESPLLKDIETVRLQHEKLSSEIAETTNDIRARMRESWALKQQARQLEQDLKTPHYAYNLSGEGHCTALIGSVLVEPLDIPGSVYSAPLDQCLRFGDQLIDIFSKSRADQRFISTQLHTELPKRWQWLKSRIAKLRDFDFRNTRAEPRMELPLTETIEALDVIKALEATDSLAWAMIQRFLRLGNILDIRTSDGLLGEVASNQAIDNNTFITDARQAIEQAFTDIDAFERRVLSWTANDIKLVFPILADAQSIQNHEALAHDLGILERGLTAEEMDAAIAMMGGGLACGAAAGGLALATKAALAAAPGTGGASVVVAFGLGAATVVACGLEANALRVQAEKDWYVSTVMQSWYFSGATPDGLMSLEGVKNLQASMSLNVIGALITGLTAVKGIVAAGRAATKVPAFLGRSRALRRIGNIGIIRTVRAKLLTDPFPDLNAPPHAKVLMRINGMTPETMMYRATPTKYLDTTNRLARGNKLSTALVSDPYNLPFANWDYTGAPERIFAKQLDLPGLNVARDIKTAIDYGKNYMDAGEEFIIIGIKLKDVFAAGGRMYLDIGGNGSRLWYFTFNDSVPYTVVTLP